MADAERHFIERENRCPTCKDQRIVKDIVSGVIVPCPKCGPEQARLRAEKMRTKFPPAQQVYTFAALDKRENLSLGESELYATACREAMAMATGNPSRPWLMLPGPNGAGKTHLVVCIANWRIDHPESGLPYALFVNVPDMIGELKDAITDHYELAVKSFMECPLLILDDLGAERETPWAVEQLYRIINHRYAGRMPMVITTNVRGDALDSRIASRLNDVGTELVTVCPMNLPSMREA